MFHVRKAEYERCQLMSLRQVTNLGSLAQKLWAHRLRLSAPGLWKKGMLVFFYDTIIGSNMISFVSYKWHHRKCNFHTAGVYTWQLPCVGIPGSEKKLGCSSSTQVVETHNCICSNITICHFIDGLRQHVCYFWVYGLWPVSTCPPLIGSLDQHKLLFARYMRCLCGEASRWVLVWKRKPKQKWDDRKWPTSKSNEDKTRHNNTKTKTAKQDTDTTTKGQRHKKTTNTKHTHAQKYKRNQKGQKQNTNTWTSII